MAYLGQISRPISMWAHYLNDVFTTKKMITLTKQVYLHALGGERTDS